MATAAEITVDAETNEVRITELRIDDPELVEHLDGRDAEERADRVRRALRVGAATLELAETSKDLEYVKREFDRMEGDLAEELDDVHDALDERFGEDGDLDAALDEYLGDDGALRDHLDDAFGEDGAFVERLNDELGEDGERIQAALDPDRDGTPTARLESRITEAIQNLRKELVAERVRAEERQKSYQGGDAFEATVAELLDDIVYDTTHEVEHTGDSEGVIPDREVGDHVLTLAGTGQRLVFESKSESENFEPGIKSEMREAMENRDAEYGIFVSECETYVPDKVGYFQEWDNEILAVALSHDPDDEIDPGFLRIAFNWARMRALQAHVNTGTSIDPEAIQAQADSVRDSIGRFSDAKSKCGSIQTTAEGIKDLLDEIKDDVTSDLDDLNAELSKHSG